MRTLHSKEYKGFLRQLIIARENSMLTQAEVAKKLHKPQSFVSKCELCERTVNAIELIKFAKVYNVSIDFFFEGINIEL